MEAYLNEELRGPLVLEYCSQDLLFNQTWSEKRHVWKPFLTYILLEPKRRCPLTSSEVFSCNPSDLAWCYGFFYRWLWQSIPRNESHYHWTLKYLLKDFYKFPGHTLVLVATCLWKPYWNIPIPSSLLHGFHKRRSK